MPPINVLIKPASGSCNMRCRYCFYTDEINNRQVKSYGIMSLNTLELLIEKILTFADKECTIAFQGGEPTLAGLDFFEQLILLQERYNTKKVKINNAIQTNGYVIDSKWAKFLAKHNFLVGLSLDGMKEIHDRERIDFAGEGTYKSVMRTIQLFQSHKVEFNILTVVTAHTAKSIKKIYGFFERNGLTYQQYIPCLDAIGQERGIHDYSLTPRLYAKFLKDLFDLWYIDVMKGKVVYNRYFENLLQIISGQRPESCGMMGVCSRQIIIEADGSVYPCDFYALDQWRLGNLITDSFEQLEIVREELGFIQQSYQIHEDCKQCKWLNLCRGGCKRDREPIIDGILSKNYFCQAYEEFFEYAYPRLEHIVKSHGPLRR